MDRTRFEFSRVIFACTCVPAERAWQQHEAPFTIKTTAQETPAGGAPEILGHVLSGRAMCSGRGCSQETDGKGTRVEGCDVKVDEECREQ